MEMISIASVEDDDSRRVFRSEARFFSLTRAGARPGNADGQPIASEAGPRGFSR